MPAQPQQPSGFQSYSCPVHGIFHVPKRKDLRGVCAFSSCAQGVVKVSDAVAYANL